MPRPARLLLAAALALVALSPSARADEPAAHPLRPHARRHRPHRRAKLAEPVGRAPRDGSGGRDAGDDKVATGFHGGKHAPAERAESVGSPNDGHLRGGAHLDVSRPYFRVVPVYERGDVRWGLPILVNMIDRAAHAVNKRFPGSVLDIGDISQRGGGDVARHHSHETGRDADLGFYAVDAKNKQVHARTFIKFDTSMASPTVPGARYDLARNWAFVQELLTDPAARVSHIFIAEWIRHELLTYARPRVSHALWDRAAIAMMQPHNSLPHDDHFHVRISCPHELHSSCIEIASTNPHGRARFAHKGHTGGNHVLRTPVRLHPHPGPGKAPAASAAVTQDPLVLPLDPIPGPGEAETDVDARDLVDESGVVRITD